MADPNELLNQPLPTPEATDNAFNQAFAPRPNPIPQVPEQLAPVADQMTPAQESSTNVINPEGELVSIPTPHLEEALRIGYQVAPEERVAHYAREQEYGGLGQQAITALEGAASAATFGASTGVERALGVEPEAIQARREVNPGIHALGQAAGLIGSVAALPGAGAAGVLTKAGELGAEALGLGAAETAAAKIGSAAVKGVVENALFQSGDEVSKALASDPAQTLDSAIANVGLSGLIGGGFGAAIGSINPLWKATEGARVNGVLKAISDKVGGIEGQQATAIDKAAEAAGVMLAPEIKAALAGDPYVQKMAQTLQESATAQGTKYQEALKAFKTDASNAAISALGKTPEQVAALEHLSEYEIGSKLKKTLAESLKANIDPISEQFNKVRDQFKGVELPQDAKQGIADAISTKATEKGYTLSASSPGTKIVNDVLGEINGLKTLEDLRKYQSIISEKTTEKQLWGLGSDLKKIFRSAEESALDRALGAEAPELVGQHAEARSAYKAAMDTIDTLNDRLHVGRYSGPGGFIKALNEMEPEAVLRRLSPKGDAGIIGELSSKFPQAAETLKDFHLSQVLKQAGMRAGPDELINPKTLFGAVEKLSPETKAFLLPPESQAKLEAVQKLLEALPTKINTSGTAKAAHALLDNLPASAAGIATYLAGHHPTSAAIAYGLTKILGGVPDYVRLGLLKFLGSSAPIDAEGFKAMVDVINNVAKGESRMNKAARSIFKDTGAVLPAKEAAQRDRDRLDKRLRELQTDPEAMLNVGGKSDHYIPGMNQAAGMAAGNAVNYLNSLRPSTGRQSPLDPKPVPSASQKAAYNRALDIANDPLIVMHDVKNGSVTQQDVNSLKVMYPGLYAKMSQKLMDQLVVAKDKDLEIPYTTRIGLSTFLGQPLDSTMRPDYILAAQPSMQQRIQQQQMAEQGQGPKHSMTALNKLAGAYRTPNQARQERELMKK